MSSRTALPFVFGLLAICPLTSYPNGGKNHVPTAAEFEQLKAVAGKDYARAPDYYNSQVHERFYTTMMPKCIGDSRKDNRRFEAILEVARDGSISRALFSLETGVTICLRKSLADVKLSVPPGGSFIAHFDIRFER